jgi:hypothetical protein
LANSNWWEWPDGSAPAHWKWPEWYQEIIQDGLPIWFKEALKEWTRSQLAGGTPAEHDQMRVNLGKVYNRGYVTEGRVDALISFFPVPKGKEDVRMVYDGTRSGLNDSIWVPRFPLPTVNIMVCALDENMFMGDMDIGEMFLNFVLHESMQALCGVDLTE